MSPSTKNLREKIWKILDQSNTWKESADKLESLLSSELSLAVKGLREEIAGAHGHVLALHQCERDELTTKFVCYINALDRFDAKAQEILGESS